MTIEFKLPDLGEGIASADVASVLVAEGEEISPGKNILELETDKAVVELPCPHAGKITKILVKPGETIKKGTVLLLLEPTGAGASKSDPAPASAAPKKSDAAAAKVAAPTGAAKTAPQPGGKVEFKLPELGEGIASAGVASILVAEGDRIESGQNVLELETDKAVVELPCPHAGTIAKIHVKAGDKLKVGTPLLTLEATSGASMAPAKTSPAAAPAAEKPAPAAAPPSKRDAPTPAAVTERATTVRQAVAPAETEKAEDGGNGVPPAPAGPATRRLARELGVDLHRVSGTGPGGRITAEDVQAYVRQLTSGEISVGSGGAKLALPPLPDFTQWGEVERVAMNKIARTTAANLSLAWQTIPHVTQHELADVTELEAGRKRHSQVKGAAKITMTVLAIKAVVAALKQYPHFNASLDTTTNEVVHKHYYNIGVAVDTEQGLLVPVIRDANQKSILEIVRELDTMAAKARERKLGLADFQGGTFTITNLGGIGGTAFSPIVNYPEVAILGMSRSKQQYVVRDSQPEVRLMLPLSLSYDHRVINGADAARFIVKVAGLLADPSQLLIES